MGQLGRNGENKDVLNYLLSSNRDYSHTRHGPVIDIDSGFNSENAAFFYGLASFFKQRLIKRVLPQILEMIKSDERAAQCTAVEVIAGVLRAFKFFEAAEVPYSFS